MVPSVAHPYNAREVTGKHYCWQPCRIGDQIHDPVFLEDRKQRSCHFCRLNRVKRKSGSTVVTRHKCNLCNIPLCIGKKKRNCFLLYHQKLASGELHVPLHESQILREFPEDFQQEMTSHVIVSTEGKRQKVCHYCRMNKVRYDSGSKIITRHKCQKCNVPLCIRRKECFIMYHWNLRCMMNKADQQS